MSEWLHLLQLLIAGVAGYFIRDIAARIARPPRDLRDVLEAFGTIDRVNACHREGHPGLTDLAADFPESGNALGVALVKAAAARGMRVGALLGFVAGAK